jgi:hypothetical protein
MSVLCLAGGGAVAKIVASAFTLVWVHTIEKTPWEEEWRIDGGGLVLVEARVKGSGAGMEPPPEARLEDGFYRWTPARVVRESIVVRRSSAHNTADWTLCAAGACAPLGDLLPEDADPVTLYPCGP